MADDLAAKGLVVIAPDQFWRDEDPGPIARSPEGMERALPRSGRSDPDQVDTDVAAVFQALKAHPACNGKVAAMGFCFGGAYVLLAAARHDIDAGISFHGSHLERHIGEAANVSCPLSLHWGDNDDVAPLEAIEEVKLALAERPDAEIYIYPGIPHGYMFPSGGDGVYDADVAARSWEKAHALLDTLRDKVDA